MKKILVIGSANTDLTVAADRMPKLGETVTGRYFSINCGGKGANQAIAVAKLGGDVGFVGAVGNDGNGEMLVKNLKANNVEFFGIVTPNAPTGTASITLVGADNFIVLNEGANGEMTPNVIKQNEEKIAQADFLVMQLEIPVESVLCAAETARKNGTKLILNPAPYKDLPPSLFALTDIMIPNEHEAGLLTGIEIKNQSDAEKAINVLRKRGVETVIVTLGEKGCVYNVNDSFFACPVQKVCAVDTTSAGDTFIGAFCVRISQGDEIHEAVKYATKAAAITVGRKGASISIPSADEIK